MTAPPPPKAIAPPAEKASMHGMANQDAAHQQLNPYPFAPPALTPAPKPPAPIGNIAKAISSVMSEIGVVAKEGVNQFHRYKYATIGDVLHKLTPLLGKHGLMIVQNEVSSELKGTRLAVVYEFSIAHSSGEVWPDKPRKTGMTVASDSKGNFDDKAYNKSATAARKYFLLELFQVPTGDVDDADSDAQSTALPPPPPQSRAPVPPPPPPPRETAPNLAPAVDESKPHRVGGKDAQEWAQNYIRAIGKVTTEAELRAWKDANSDALVKLEKNHTNIYDRLRIAVETKLSEIAQLEAVLEPVSDEDFFQPLEANDFDTAINIIANRLTSFHGQEELEAWWNKNVAPTEERWFPPDWALLIKEFERNEVRIAAQEAK